MASLDYLRTEGNYYVYSHPVAGEVQLHKNTIEKYGNNPEAINGIIADTYADALIKRGEVPDSWDAFKDTFDREITSSIRGIEEWLRGEKNDKTKRTSTYEEDFMDAVYSTTNSGAYWSGLLLGALADPVTLPAFFLKAIKLGKLTNAVKGAAVGGTGGFLTPDRPEWGTDTFTNTTLGASLGTPLGVLFGDLLPRLARKGIKVEGETVEEVVTNLEKLADEGGEAVQEIIFDEAKEASKVLAEKSAAQLEDEFNQNLANIQDSAPTIRTPADEQADILSRIAQRQEADNIRNQYEANLQRIQNDPTIAAEEKARIRAEYEKTLEEIQRGGAGAEMQARLRTNMEEAFTPEQIEERTRNIYLSELEQRIRAVQNIGMGSARENQEAVTALRTEIRNLNAMLTRAESGAKTKLPADELRSRINKRQEDLEAIVNRRDAMKQRENDVKELIAIKDGNITAEFRKRLEEARYSPPTRDLPRPADADMQAFQRMFTQNIPARTANESFTPMTINDTLRAGTEVQQAQIMNDLQQRRQAMPVQALSTQGARVPEFATPYSGSAAMPISGVRPIAEPTQAPVQAPTSNVFLPTNQPKSLSSAGASQDLPYSVVRDAMYMNTNSRAAGRLPEPRAVQSMELSDAQKVRESALQQAEGKLGLSDNIIQEGMDRGRVTDSIVDADTQATQRAMRSAIRDGEAINPADYLMQRFDATGGALSLGETRLLEIASAEARSMMEKSQTRLVSLGRRSTAARVGEVQQMQLIAEEMEVYNRLREFVRVGQAAKGRNAAMLRQYKKTNKMAREQIRNLREGRTVTQLFFGVDC